LADTLELRESRTPNDVVLCPDVPGENLAARALAASREAGLLSGGPLELEIYKKVPIAAGMGGGSADAAATLRLAAAIEGRPPADYERVAFLLGADVPSQLIPGAALVHGAGERVSPIDPLELARAEARAYVIIQQQRGLATAEVFAQADRSGLPEPEVVHHEESLLEKLADGIDLAGLCALVHNALEPAILALRPELAPLPGLLAEHGALAAAFTGSGPTCFGVFADQQAAESAAEKLAEIELDVHVALPVAAQFAAVRESGAER
jgi:4-diphosphocytidyl-2-C-methyl-D-erythritol kinase